MTIVDTFELPMFPLGTAVLPGQKLPLHVFEPRYRDLVHDCLAAPEPRFGVVLIARGHEVGGGDVRYDVGTIANIDTHAAIGDGRFELLCRTTDRIRIVDWLEDDPYPRAVVEKWPDENDGAPITEYEYSTLGERIDLLYGLLGKLAAQANDPRPTPPILAAFQGSLGSRLFEVAAHVPMGDADKLALLAAPGADERIRALAETIENAIEMVQFKLL
ncbi:LON peptidase substrate-binding domain-containing protein [Rhodococcus sp. NPDC058521]|uniref:LON peptidase substrate-binding domain-containing protein n=1 Tax=Rhodococcus sp. NPDC058521 TaxID=3346536 RepID=UPI003648CAB3